MPRGKRKASEMDSEEEADETPRKLTKREKREAAIARAKESMKADKQKVEARKAKKEGKPIPEEPKPAKTATRKSPVKQSPKRSPPRTNQTRQTVASDEEMDDVKPAASVKPQAQSQPTYSNRKSPPSYSHRSNPIVAAAAPPSPEDVEEEEDDDEIPPPPMASLQAQISHQVLANMAAIQENKPTLHTQPPPAAFENPPEVDGDEVEELVHDENPIVIDEEYLEVTSKPFFSKSTLFWVFLVAIVSYVVMQDDTITEIGGASTAFVEEAPCFKDNVMVDQETGVINSCADNGGLACPDGGTCKFGKLVQCISKHYEVSENKDSCVLTSLSKEKVAAIQVVLEEKTLQGGCHISADEYSMFPYKDIQLANPLVIANDPLEVSIVENEFNVQRNNGVLHIGLKSDYNLKKPMHCLAASAVTSFLGTVGGLMVSAFHFFFATAFELFMEYPGPSSIVILVVFILQMFLRRRSYRKQLADDVSKIRQFAYDYLQDSPDMSHIALHVRDHIVMERYPKKKRNYLKKDVWPRVVPDLKADNRIRKTTRIVEGQPKDAWQWVAAVTSAKKKPQTIQ
ncbi:unnamed protein product [Cylindrotheca closterium]|uniref:Man1/Src1 C-terminal domain-containing protein n=1 Tax=Cylindrotheca closterium TaxID=2856 RepID=A0AAD2JJB4_9STRA|nr:unnamed protein product [Cylindrotheca closterium]